MPLPLAQGGSRPRSGVGVRNPGHAWRLQHPERGHPAGGNTFPASHQPGLSSPSGHEQRAHTPQRTECPPHCLPLPQLPPSSHPGLPGTGQESARGRLGLGVAAALWHVVSARPHPVLSPSPHTPAGGVRAAWPWLRAVGARPGPLPHPLLPPQGTSWHFPGGRAWQEGSLVPTAPRRPSEQEQSAGGSPGDAHHTPGWHLSHCPRPRPPGAAQGGLLRTRDAALRWGWSGRLGRPRECTPTGGEGHPRSGPTSGSWLQVTWGARKFLTTMGVPAVRAPSGLPGSSNRSSSDSWLVVRPRSRIS